MSALHETLTDDRRRPDEYRGPDEHRGPAGRLRLVPRARITPVGRVPFGILVATLLVVGMIGLLLLNTTLQNQAFEANRLKRQATTLGYTEGELQQSVVEAGSTRELTRRATALGLRPNHWIAYVDLGRGKVTGAPAAQDPFWMPEALTLSPEEVRRNNETEAVNVADHRREAETKAVADARQRILDARARAEAEARAKAEADARARGQVPPAGPNAAVPNGPVPNGPVPNGPVPNGPVPNGAVPANQRPANTRPQGVNQPANPQPANPNARPANPNGAR